MFLSLVEGARGVLPSPGEFGIEEVISNLVLWLKLFIEVVGVTLIAIGVVITSVRLAGVLRYQRLEDYGRARVGLARFLIIGLEFQLAADIVGTAFAPSWTQIGKLAAIAVIRTGLNYFLSREMKEEGENLAARSGAGESPSAA